MSMTVFNEREMKLLQVWINNPALISISHAWPDTFNDGICEEYDLTIDELLLKNHISQSNPKRLYLKIYRTI